MLPSSSALVNAAVLTTAFHRARADPAKGLVPAECLRNRRRAMAIPLRGFCLRSVARVTIHA
ncbi:hypothetical protein J2S94_003976 [Arthrobacter bambusae]|nr:hypothetical protein [Arthrobacter bambusae]